jgi:hypothetical protein
MPVENLSDATRLMLGQAANVLEDDEAFAKEARTMRGPPESLEIEHRLRVLTSCSCAVFQFLDY